jgi:hypothetical protein
VGSLVWRRQSQIRCNSAKPKELEREGKADKAKGDMHKAAGKVKDAARNTADTLKK